jgi:peptidyl-dipeptidase Dcp
MSDNPFFEPSTLPYQLPPFAAIREEHYAPALERGMAVQLEEIAAIVAGVGADVGAGGDGSRVAGAPTFENTIIALERSGALLRRVLLAFQNKADSDTTPGLQALQAEFSPRLAAHEDEIRLDAGLFARIRALYEDRASLADAVSVRLVERYYADFVRAGALLSDAEKGTLRGLNTELASLSTQFEQNLFDSTNARGVVLDSASELEGLSADAVSAAAANATARGFDGKYLLSLILPSNQPLLASLARRPVRERLFAASVGRGLPGNRELVVRMARLRAERAALLGYASHAAYEVEDQTAGSVEAVEALLTRLVPAAMANARREAELLRAAFAADGDEGGGGDGDGDGGDGSSFAAWDWQYYAEKVRKNSYDVDAATLRPYFELERVLRDGVFYAAERVYGLRFAERDDLTGYHEDVRVFEVFEENGEPLGLFLADFYARASKRGGAWMNSLVPQSGLFGTKPVVVNNLNIAKPPQGEPTLLTFDETRTLFHEFGHALHGLFSDVYAPRLAGTQVPRDFVEYPSQVNEMWEVWPEVLANYARHYRTGEPIPDELVRRMEAAERFGQGFKTVEYLGAALLDWAWHTIPGGAEPGDAIEFEENALRDAGIAFAEIPPRYRSTYFAHAWQFGYAAGYYSYIWSEVLDAETVEWFKENGGMTRANGETFRRELLSRGNSVDPLAAFRAVRGRGARIDALLDRRGLR